MPEVRLVEVTKRFGGFTALDRVSFHVRDGEYAALLGPSGCGKTTALRIIAGLLKPDEGTVYIDGEAVNDVPPEDRGIGFVFQNYALFPHMTLWGNTVYGPTIRGWNPETVRRLAKEMLAMVHLTGREDSYPHELSGGMQQRAALARALASGAKLLLLDEPLAALHARLRAELRYELRRLAEDLGLTVIHVTHDQEEAMTLSDKIIVMRRGRLEQVGTPEEIYFNPKTPFIANFIGEANFFEGYVLKEAREGLYVTIRGDLILQASGGGFHEGERVVLAVKPEFISLETPAPGDINLIPGRIERIRFIGSFIRYEVRLVNEDLTAVRVTVESKPHLNVGDEVSLRFNPDRIHVFSYPREGLMEATKVE
ncbi:MAG: ABC transporter ATP-binding protein [Candidatus Bathyarchaeia archaeon]|nr:ABC transporter ATP-binding protein [Candidatus Bathyarchaeota archaeon]